MIRLSVNINKIATLRNARGGNNPNVLQVAKDCVAFGAQGITVHPRPDERHIRRQDVLDLSGALSVEFNIEGYPSPDFINLVERVRPAQVTLVPDPPDALTSNTGWDSKTHKSFLIPILKRFQEAGIRTSLFTNAEIDAVAAAADTGTNRIELYTEPYASGYSQNKEQAIHPFILAAEEAQKCSLGLNAGHDLSLENLSYFAQHLPGLLEVSIGHALVCDALYLGLEKTILAYLTCLKTA
jgi:pyridoxine 5-phosphate synthase